MANLHVSWAGFAAADPHLANFGAQRLSHLVAYFATIRSDGGNGEFGIRGSAIPIEDTNERTRLFAAAAAKGFHPKDHYVLFELRIETAFSTVYDNNGLPDRKIWKPNST